jgi:hypothetical protein
MWLLLWYRSSRTVRERCSGEKWGLGWSVKMLHWNRWRVCYPTERKLKESLVFEIRLTRTGFWTTLYKQWRGMPIQLSRNVSTGP